MAEDREPRSWLASQARIDPLLLRDAERAFAARGGGEDGYLAARRLLDDRLRQMVHWPRGLDYAQIADDFAEAGEVEEVMLLRRVAATDGLLTGAHARWNGRYATRAATRADRNAGRFIDGGLIDFDPDGPYPGIDGALYWPGYTSLDAGLAQAPVMAVLARGMRELVTGFADQSAVERWLHDRGPMASGSLVSPQVPTRPRAVLEEQVLARLLRSPDELPEITARLPPATFTADARYEIYAAILALTSTGQPCDAGRAAEEVSRRIDWVPGWALPRYGGHGAPWVQAYLRRLDATDVTPAAARTAARQLAVDDANTTLTAGGPGRTAQHDAASVTHPRQMPEADQWQQQAARAGHGTQPEIQRPPSPPSPSESALRM